MSSALAIDGGSPVRTTLLPYGRPSVSEDDIAAVSTVLRRDFLTTGPEVTAFEKDFATAVRSSHAVAMSNGTTALHSAFHAIGIRKGDEVIVPVITFAATANAIVMQGGTPVFADVDDALLIDPKDIEQRMTKKTKAICAVDYAGQPCDYDALSALCAKHKLLLIADACHALGAEYRERPVGSLADLSAFSFHPVKPITTGEGGMVTTENTAYAENMRKFRHHNLSLDPEERKQRGSWYYDIEEIGYNYRLTDIQCALGRSQLKKLHHFMDRRREIAMRYDAAFAMLPGLSPLIHKEHRSHAHHLYVVRWAQDAFSVNRQRIFQALHAEGIGVNLHYTPLHLLSVYRSMLDTREGMFPKAEAAYAEMLTLPLFATMTDRDSDDVIAAVTKVHKAFVR